MDPADRPGVCQCRLDDVVRCADRDTYIQTTTTKESSYKAQGVADNLQLPRRIHPHTHTIQTTFLSSLSLLRAPLRRRLLRREAHPRRLLRASLALDAYIRQRTFRSQSKPLRQRHLFQGHLPR